MKRAAIVLALAASLLLASVALAQSGGGYDLHWNTVDGGGHTFHAGGDYALGGTAGQPDAGVLSGGGYILGGGFWCGGTAAQYRIYLPLVLRNHMVYFEGPWESEDNDSCTAANGPLRSGRDYLGYPDDTDDYYYFVLSARATVTVSVTDFAPTSTDGDLILYGPAVGNERGNLIEHYGIDGHSSMSLHPHLLEPGKYCVRVYTAKGYSTTQHYHLTVTY